MASGELLASFTPQHMEYPTAGAAQLDTRGDGHTLIDFDDSTTEVAYFKAYMPQNYSGGGITVTISWVAEATSGTVDWLVAFERLPVVAQDIDNGGFAASKSVGRVVPLVSGAIKNSTITFTDGAEMDSIAAGNLFRMKVSRDALLDDAVGDASVIAVKIEET